MSDQFVEQNSQPGDCRRSRCGGHYLGKETVEILQDIVAAFPFEIAPDEFERVFLAQDSQRGDIEEVVKGALMAYRTRENRPARFR